MKVIAMQEMARGNESIGTMWTEAKIFNPDTPVSEIVEWGRNLNQEGKLILTVDMEG